MSNQGQGLVDSRSLQISELCDMNSFNVVLTIAWFYKVNRGVCLR